MGQEPWSEKVPGVSDRQSEQKQLMDAIQKLMSGAGQVGGQSQPGGMVVPGQVPPIPGSSISFDPSRSPSGPLPHAGPRPPMQPQQTGSQSIGHFANRGEATNAGLVSLGNSLSGLFNAVGEKEHNKKAAMAENYMMQISGLLASGDPQDKEKAMMFLEDPKIKKILKTGLEYVPLEEEVPPEAKGVQTAVQKIAQKQQGGQPQPKQMRPVLPQASQEQQLRSAMTSALLQKLRDDPGSAIQMMGGSNLTSAENRAAEFYEKGLGMSPVQVAALSSAEKLAGLKTYEAMYRDTVKAEIDVYKADKGYAGKVDSAKIYAAARDRMTDAIKANHDKKGQALNYAAGAKVYADIAKQYMEMAKSGKDQSGKPLDDEKKKYYEQQAQQYQQKADDFLNQQGDEELMNLFMDNLSDKPDNEE